MSTSDLKIASIALAHDATLLTRNLHDFTKVPGLRIAHRKLAVLNQRPDHKLRWLRSLLFEHHTEAAVSKAQIRGVVKTT